MTRRVKRCGLLLVILMALPTCTVCPEASERWMKSLGFALAWQAHIHAAREKDLDAVVAIYTEDVLYQVAGQELRGLTAVREMEARSLATTDILPGVTHEPGPVAVFGDVAYEVGTIAGPVQPAGEEPREVTFHFMAQWVRGDDGQWRIAALVGR